MRRKSTVYVIRVKCGDRRVCSGETISRVCALHERLQKSIPDFVERFEFEITSYESSHGTILEGMLGLDVRHFQLSWNIKRCTNRSKQIEDLQDFLDLRRNVLVFSNTFSTIAHDARTHRYSKLPRHRE